MADSLRDKLIAARQTPEARQFLDFIAEAEGVKHGYNTLFGNGRFESLDDHPRKLFRPKINGKVVPTTAAGRYQINKATWDEIVRNIDSKDFSAEEQDLGALYLLHRAGALDDILAGRPQAAISKIGSRWPSVSSGTVGQNRMSKEAEAKWFKDHALPVIPASIEPFIPKQFKPVIESIGNTIRAARSHIETGEPLPVFQTPATEPVSQVTEDDLAQDVRAVMAQREQARPDPAAVLWGKLRDTLGNARAKERIEVEDTPPWEQGLVAAALDADADAITHNAVSRFMGEPETTRIALPKSLEAAIDQALRNI